MPFQSQLKAYAKMVDERLEVGLPPRELDPQPLHEAMRYSALAPGKRLRPALVLACAESVGGSANDALDAACAVELVHCFSLIHDDLPALDDDDLRRGLPTCHVKFGEAVAILAGDALFALAFQMMCASPGEPARVLACARALTIATMELVQGETTDILSEGQQVSAATLSAIHRAKTGALIAASCRIGGILGGASDAVVAGLAEYGWQIGLAFQIADDVLNETSTPEQLGKSAGSDRERGKATYPGVHGLDASRKAARHALQAGIAALKNVPNRGFLEEMARYAVERVH